MTPKTKTHEAPWSSLIDGIFYAANHGAKVIEMNVAGKLPRKTYTDDNGTPNYPGDDYVVEYNRDIKDLVIALTRATLYANLMGATLVAPAGKHPGTNALVVDAILRKSADDYGAPGKDAYFGYGQVDAGKAVDY